MSSKIIEESTSKGESKEKRFIDFWSASTYSKDQHKVVWSEQFTEDNGYDEEDIAAIEALEIGQEWTSNDLLGGHTVRRVV